MDQHPILPAGASSPSISPGRSIRLFLVDGTPQGVISAEIVNWTGKALSAPRARLTDLLRRSEAARTGVYILMGPDPDRPAGVKAYVGEADNIGARLRNHLRSEEKDFFERLVIIVAKDDNLTKAHARFLESQLLRIAKETGAVALANGYPARF
ncbi:MAG TPA: GIY-YIG nuclease family protein [Afifellaceae bacterium]|nr:GIY-YIG nuclease family protein [Afifellaceae bacterium]